MRKKITFLKSFLLLLVLLVASVTTIKAQKVPVASFTRNSYANWTVMSSNKTYFKILQNDSIQMKSDLDFSVFKIDSISVEAGRQGVAIPGSTNVLRVTMGGVEIFRQEVGAGGDSKRYTVYAANFTHLLTGNGKIKLDCPLANEAAGLRLYSFTVYGTSTISESFENVESSPTSSYNDFSWTADDNTSWSTTDTRIDEEINGKAICIKTGTMTSAIYTSGMGVLSFKYRQGPAGSGNIEVYVNDLLEATLIADSETVTTFTKKINISGDVTLKLTSTDAGSAVIDDVSWTIYDATDSPGMIFSGGNRYIASGSWQATDLQDVAAYVGNDSLAATTIDFTFADIDATGVDFPTDINPNCLLKTATAGRFAENNVVEGACLIFS